jgi:hypothetical protein|tara:strand:+ start:1153 stop:1356 length:204 start_codon:yes stop_codon:yes gene_type:complete
MDAQREYGPNGEDLSWDELLNNWLSAENSLIQRDERINALEKQLAHKVDTIDTITLILRTDARCNVE